MMTKNTLEKFKFLGIKDIVYGKRKQYIIPYNDFIETFNQKIWWNKEAEIKDIQSKWL